MAKLISRNTKMSAKHVRGVVRSKAWDGMRESLLKRSEKIGEKLVVTVGGEGRRVFPGSSAQNDAKFQMRVDCGSTVQGSPNLLKVYLQVNS